MGLAIDTCTPLLVETDHESPRGRIYSESRRGLHGERSRDGSITIRPVRVVLIKEGSVAHADGRIKVNDEIIDINGRALHKETAKGGR